MSWAGMMPPTKTFTDCMPFSLRSSRMRLQMGRWAPGQDGEADHVGVLLRRRGHDLLGALPEAGVDDLHARVAQGAGDDLRPPVVAVEARLGHQYPDLPVASSWSSKDRGLLVFAKDLAQRVTHLAEGRVGTRGLEDGPHHVVPAPGRVLQALERAHEPGLVAGRRAGL